MTIEELAESIANIIAPVVAEEINKPLRSRFDESSNNMLSDARCKCIERIRAKKEPLNERDMKILIASIGDMDNDHKFKIDGDTWDDSVLDKYAEYIHNYEYTYKPEATKIDPRIDPEQMQIGPMAQDIEQVNPACIEETEDGIKTVNTGKLAMMNAGAIADLTREIEEIKEVLHG